MAWKFITGIIAIVLVLAYVTPLAVKLKEISLAVVIAIAVVMMLVDMFQTLRSKDH